MHRSCVEELKKNVFTRRYDFLDWFRHILGLFGVVTAVEINWIPQMSPIPINRYVITVALSFLFGISDTTFYIHRFASN